MDKESPLHNMMYVTKLVVVVVLLLALGLCLKNKYVIGMAVAFALFIAFFFRNNLSTLARDENYFLSPSSSKIKSIDQDEDGTVIYTYLSPLDRHFMIAPVDCTITDIENIKVKESDSERVRVSFEDTSGNKFSLDQIVSKLGQGAWMLSFLYGTRCVVFGKVGDKLEQGERYGLIRFGSNMQYNLPKSYEVLTAVDNKVQPGDVIAAVKPRT